MISFLQRAFGREAAEIVLRSGEGEEEEGEGDKGGEKKKAVKEEKTVKDRDQVFFLPFSFYSCPLHPPFFPTPPSHSPSHFPSIRFLVLFKD